MKSSLFKIFLKTLILSLIIYIFYMILTPLKIEFIPYLGIFMYSFFIVVVCEIFIHIVKVYIDKVK